MWTQNTRKPINLNRAFLQTSFTIVYECIDLPYNCASIMFPVISNCEFHGVPFINPEFSSVEHLISNETGMSIP